MRSTNGELKELISDHEFEVNHLYNYEEIDYEFNAKIDEVYAEANRIEYEFNELKDELNELRAGFRNTVGASTTDLQAARGIDVKLKELSLLLNGDPSRTKREMETVPSLGDVVGILAWGAWNHRGAPTGSMKNMLEDAQAMIKDAAMALESIEEQIDKLEEKAQNQGVPYWD
jgi:peptidoglycan hydrolase CwlO-like protein